MPPESSPRCTLSAHGSEAACSRIETRASSEPAIEVFYARDYGGEVVDVAFLVDSFYYMKRGKNSKYEYLPEVLSELRRRTGLTCMAICSGGAQLVSPSSGAATYAQLLSRVPSGGVMALVAIVSGNDVYNRVWRKGAEIGRAHV